ncbi:MAG: guanylate kinase [bacterium]
MQKLLLVLTGTSGSGKTTLCSRFLEEIPSTARVITTTTRLPRKGETDGIDYHFETDENFRERIKRGDFLEYAEVYGHFYGTAKTNLLDKSYAEKDLIICLDVQGAQTLKAKWEDSTMGRRLVTVFVSPASLDELRLRLVKRGTDNAQTIQKRLLTAEMELRSLHRFDYHLCSQDRTHDWICLTHIFFAEKMRI